MEVCLDNNQVIKTYNLIESKKDRLGYTPSDYYHNEKYAYECLKDVTYLTRDGRKMQIIPHIYEIGENYIVMEKYQTSLNKELVGGVEFWNCDKVEPFDQVVDNYIKPLIDKLCQIGIDHNDVFARNIIMDFNENRNLINRLAIIDFGLASFHKQVRSTEEILFFLKQDLLTSVPDLYD